MSKKEDIVINDEYEYPRKSKMAFYKEKLYREESSLIESSLDVDMTLSPKAVYEGLIKRFEDLPRVIESTINEYLFLKLYKSSVVNNLDGYSNDTSLIEKYCDRLKGDYKNAKKAIDHSKIIEILSREDLDVLYEKISYLYDFVYGLQNDIVQYQKKYYNEFKLTSYMVTKEKTNSEMEDLIYRVNKVLSEFKSVEDANDYFVFNSGIEIMDFVNSIVNTVKKMKKSKLKVDYHYFLETDDIISFTQPEWVKLYAKIKFIIGKIKDEMYVPQELSKKYVQFETKFAIISIYKEL